MADQDPITVRLAALEARIGAIEARLGGRPEPARAAQGPSVREPVPDPDAAVVAAGRPGPAVSARPAAPAPPAPPFSLADLEERLSARVLAWAGGLALIAGAVFFLSLAFSRGWIGPEQRVVIGLIAAVVALAGGGRLAVLGHRAPGTALVAVGVGTGMLALFAASRLYGLVAAEPAMLGALLLAIGAAAIAIRLDSAGIGALGLVAVTAAPPIMGADPTPGTAVYLGTALVGVMLVALWRSWPWLPLIAFTTTAGQVNHWLGMEPSVALGVVATASYWLVHAIAAGGEALRRPRPVVHAGATLLLVANALFAIHLIETVLREADPAVRIAALVALALGHAALAVPALRRGGSAEPFATLAAGTAVGVLTIGIALELDGAARPIGWTALGLGLAWVAARSRHGSAALGALVLAALADAQILWDLTLAGLAETRAGWPFASAEGIAAVVLVGAILAAAVMARAWRPRAGWWIALLVGAGAVAGHAGWFELQPDGAVVLWAGIAAALALLLANVRRDPIGALVALVGSWTAAAIGLVVTLALIAPLDRLAVEGGRTAGPILVNGATATLGGLALALAATAAALRQPEVRLPPGLGTPRALAGATLVVAGALLVHLGSLVLVDLFQARLAGAADPAEVATQARVALSIGWVLAGAAILAGGLVGRSGLARGFGLGLLALATAKVFIVDLATVDVAYRVLSLVGLGLVLVGMSYAVGRFRRVGRSPATVAGPGDGGEAG